MGTSQASGRRLVLDVVTFLHPSQLHLGRNFELQTFCERLGIEVLSPPESVLARRLVVAARMLLRLSFDFVKRPQIGHFIASESQSLGRLSTVQLSRAKYVDGYFADVFGRQSYEDSIEKVLALMVQDRRRLLSNSSPLGHDVDLALHLRMGDMLKARDGHRKSLEKILASLSDTVRQKIVIFTDDEFGASRMLTQVGLQNWEFAPSSMTSYETLLLMSSAKELVCSPSTFSWWAGLLCSKTGGQVTFPKDFENSGLIQSPSEWILK